MWAIGYLLWASHDTPGFILSNGLFGVQLGVRVMGEVGILSLLCLPGCIFSVPGAQRYNLAVCVSLWNPRAFPHSEEIILLELNFFQTRFREEIL